MKEKSTYHTFNYPDKTESEKDIEKPITNHEYFEEYAPIYLYNAGIVLLAPYLPRLFNLLKFTERNTFVDQQTQIRALFVMQYLVFGDTMPPEYEMTLNRLLVNFETVHPIPQQLELTGNEKETGENLLQAVLQNWEKLKNTSIAGLREGFLQRDGRLEEKYDSYLLVVEQKSYDMLLDSIPWSFSSIKYNWMQKRIDVKWR